MSYTINERNHIDMALLLAAWIWLLISLLYSLNNTGQTLFSRAGGVLFLFAVIVECRHVIMVRENDTKLEKLATAPYKYRWSATWKAAGLLAHFSILTGGLVWALGDIVLP